MRLIIPFATFVSLSVALYAPKGSSCAIECGTKASNFTGTGDLVCLDTAYDDNSKGVLFKQCVSCLSTSTYVNDTSSYNGNSDQYWYLWHIKYVQQYCLIDTPQTAAAKNCASKCDGLHDPLKVSWIYNKGGVQSQYGYCSWNSSAYMTYASECATCLQGEEGGVVIGNLADITYNACKTQPQAIDGDLVTSSRDIFDSAIIDPNVTISSVSTSASSDTSSDTSSPTAPAASSATSNANQGSTVATSTTTTPTTSAATSGTASIVDSQSSGLSSPAAAGIGVGSAVLVLAFAAGIFFIMRRRKRAPKPERLTTPSGLTTPPAYAHELGHDGQVNEIGGGEKRWRKVSVHETGGLPLQELDASGRR